MIQIFYFKTLSDPYSLSDYLEKHLKIGKFFMVVTVNICRTYMTCLTVVHIHLLSQAKTIFTSICPDEEFLPRPPNPEDIIYCDDESKKQAEGETFTAEQSEAQQGQHEQSEKEAEPGNNESEAGGHEPEADKSDCKSSEHLEAKTSAVEEPES